MAPDPAASEDLGQHFLTDDEMIERIVDAAGLVAGETVLDVGAGRGALTLPLRERVGPEGHVIAVEVDPRHASILRSRARDGVEVIEGDALTVPLPSVDAVVANPPFRIAAPLVTRLVAHGFARAVLVLPEELVDRLTADPGSERYGKLTVQLGVRATTRKLFHVPRRAFDPKPDIHVSVAGIVLRKDAPAHDDAMLARILDAAWKNRRRKLRHALGSLGTELRVSSGLVTQALREAGVEDRRFDEVPPDVFAALSVTLARARRVEP